MQTDSEKLYVTLLLGDFGGQKYFEAHPAEVACSVERLLHKKGHLLAVDRIPL